jgi:hypothetical protein
MRGFIAQRPVTEGNGVDRRVRGRFSIHSEVLPARQERF